MTLSYGKVAVTCESWPEAKHTLRIGWRAFSQINRAFSFYFSLSFLYGTGWIGFADAIFVAFGLFSVFLCLLLFWFLFFFVQTVIFHLWSEWWYDYDWKSFIIIWSIFFDIICLCSFIAESFHIQLHLEFYSQAEKLKFSTKLEFRNAKTEYLNYYILQMINKANTQIMANKR